MRQQFGSGTIRCLNSRLKEMFVLDSDSQEEHFTLQPARMGMLNCYKHLDIDTFDTWTCVHGFGVATFEQKQSALNAFISEGEQLNEKYFLNVPAHELWLDQNLAGLCQLRSVISEHQDSLTINAVLDAIFILKRYRGNGLSSGFVDSIWSSLISEYMDTIYRAKLKGMNQFLVMLHADFESQAGESVFNHLFETMHSFFETAKSALGVTISIRPNAKN